jgi:hypothetical protein
LAEPQEADTATGALRPNNAVPVSLVFADIGQIIEDQQVKAIEPVMAASSASSRRATCSR